MGKYFFKPLARSLVRKVKKLMRPPLHVPSGRYDYVVVGSDYGGWPVLKESLTIDSVVYSFGVGTDISFDVGIIQMFGCEVFAFDPTPRCISWVENQDLPIGFRFYEVGLSDRVGTLSFSAPANDEFVSYTIGYRHGSTEMVELPVEALDVLMNRFGHSTIDFLKVDIEGSEYLVIEDMIAKSIFPLQFCVEFHHDMYGYSKGDTKRAVDLLLGCGYRIHYVSASGREYGFHRF